MVSCRIKHIFNFSSGFGGLAFLFLAFLPPGPGTQ